MHVSNAVIDGKCCVDEHVILVQVCSLKCQALELGSAHVLGNSGYFLVVVFICCILSNLLGQE